MEETPRFPYAHGSSRPEIIPFGSCHGGRSESTGSIKIFNDLRGKNNSHSTDPDYLSSTWSGCPSRANFIWNQQLRYELYSGVDSTTEAVVCNLDAESVRDNTAELFFSDDIRESG